MSAERKFRAVSESVDGQQFVVTIEYDPTSPKGMRWAAKVDRRDGYPVARKSSCMTRRSAERQALKHIRRMPGARSYTFTVTRDEAAS